MMLSVQLRRYHVLNGGICHLLLSYHQIVKILIIQFPEQDSNSQLHLQLDAVSWPNIRKVKVKTKLG